MGPCRGSVVAGRGATNGFVPIASRLILRFGSVVSHMDRDRWNARYAARELIWSAEPNRFLVAETQDLTPARALDIGAGEGRNALWLAARGWKVTAVDFSEVAISKGRRIADDKDIDIEWVVADLRTYSPPERGFDLVIEMYVQVPEPLRRDVWRRAADAVAPGGTLLIVGHDLTNLEHGYGGPRNPASLFTPDDVTEAIEGLDVVRAERVDRPVEGGVAIDALVRAVRGSV
jgi:SAM-dependent methyltransferase